MSGNDGGWVLPENPQPEGVRQFCITVPDEPAYRQAFAGALLSLTRWWNWQRDDAHTAAIVTAVWRPLVAQALLDLDSNEGCGGGMDCCDFLIAQNNQIIAGNDYMANKARLDAYDGTPGSINPDAPNFDFGYKADPLAASALCLALERYIGHLLYTLMITTCGSAIAENILETALEFIFGTYLVNVVGGYNPPAATLVCQDALDALNDPDARADAVCTMYKALKGVDVSPEDFAAAWDNAVAQTPEGQVLIDSMNQPSIFLQNYTWFLDLLGEAYALAEQGVEADCSCPQDCSQFFDFRVSGYDMTPFKVQPDQGETRYGVRVPGQGWRTSDNSPNCDAYSTLCRQLDFSEPCFEPQYKYSLSTTSGAGQRAAIRAWDVTAQQWTAWSGSLPAGNNIVQNWAGLMNPANGYDKIQIRACHITNNTSTTWHDLEFGDFT